MMCRLLMFTLMVGMFILTCPSASAADPDPVIVYQGRITQAGAPVTGTHTLSFVLIDVGGGGTTLWSSGNLSLSVTEGLYSVVLGGAGQPAIPTTVLNKASLAVSVTYDGTVLTPDAALKPALQARYAFAAGNATTADSATALSGVNDVTHGGTGSATAAGARTNLGLGTVATLNAPASGDAAAAEVVKGNDTRLSDARTPVAHAHAGADITSGTVPVARLPAMGAASAGTPGTAGLVPAPAAGDQNKLLRGDGTWTTAGSGTGDVVAANNLSDLANAATARTNLGLGTTATKNVPATGDAAATEVVQGNDTRLSDVRTPADLSVTTGKLVDGSVTTAKIDPAVLTPFATKAEVSADLAGYTTTGTTSTLATRVTTVEAQLAATPLMIPASTAAAVPSNAGALRWTGGSLQLSDGSSWSQISSTAPLVIASSFVASQPGATIYASVPGQRASSYLDAFMLVPFNGTLREVRVALLTAAANQVTVSAFHSGPFRGSPVGGTNQLAVVIVPGSAANFMTSTSGSFSVQAGDIITISIADGGGSATATTVITSLIIDRR